MRGGHRYRFFFFIQSAEYLTTYNESLPDFTPTPEEVDAGFSWLSESFEFSATLYRTSREMNINPEVLVNDWNAREFWHLVRFLSWESKVQRDYQELMSAKAQREARK